MDTKASEEKPMNRTIKSLVFATALPLVGAFAICASPKTAEAQYYAPPPPGYVASYEPVYYNGYAHYYYGNRWYYRDHGGAWQYYNHEPAYFGGYRGGWEGRRHSWR
jgi:hypothetical protein